MVRDVERARDLILDGLAGGTLLALLLGYEVSITRKEVPRVNANVIAWVAIAALVIAVIALVLVLR